VQLAIGIADSIVIENFMNAIFGSRYVNYHFHKLPKIDITRIGNESAFEADLVTCSDVLEHVQAPVENGFLGLNKILKDKGILIMSVPHTDKLGSHVEHFPVLKEFRIIEEEKKVLIGTDYEGNLFKTDELIFHGGDGEVLEFRVFSETSLKKYLSRSSFTKIKEVKNNSFFGINWEPWSRVWVAKANK
jgi:SAM-dependent methyltransferase